ncbi:hypothetical protein [Paenibacillus phocaensis]|uniref:hypothetical protein n=1 Tax=Paenibacillus phocaensis TaxID=1776378 RepID=UPI0003A35B14|nr:hypothetical protein [Paenibacillus phocaensis]
MNRAELKKVVVVEKIISGHMTDECGRAVTLAHRNREADPLAQAGNEKSESCVATP